MSSSSPAAARLPTELMRAALSALPEVTETLAAEFAGAGTVEPDWPAWKWGAARGIVTIHGMAGVLAANSTWRESPGWRKFLQDQRDHIAERQRAVARLLEVVETAARAAGIRVMPLKGGALPAFGFAPVGLRPLADLDLLADRADRAGMYDLLLGLGYRQIEESWKHLAFAPSNIATVREFGEHRDRAIGIDLHFFVRERLASGTVDITDEVRASTDDAGSARYSSRVGMLRHLLLHTAANFARQWLRGIQLHDIASIAATLHAHEWDGLRAAGRTADERWWMYAPLLLTARYWPRAIPPAVLDTLANDCGSAHRRMASEMTLYRASVSNPHLTAFPEILWSRSVGGALQYCWGRIFPSRELLISYSGLTDRADFAANTGWYRMSHKLRMLTWLFNRPPRPATAYMISSGIRSQLADHSPPG